MGTRSYIFPLMLTVSFLLYLILLIDDRLKTYFFCIIPLFLIYFVLSGFSIVRPEQFRFPLKYILAAALIFRIVLIPAGPILSTDAGHSISPAAQLAFLDNILPEVNPIIWKILLLIGEIVITLLLIRLLDHFQIPRTRLIVFSLNPLLIIETYRSGHNEILIILVMVAGVWYFFNSRQIRSVLFLTIAALLAAAAAFRPGSPMPVSGLFPDANGAIFNGGLYQLITNFIRILEVGFRDWFNTSQTMICTDPEICYGIFATLVLMLVIIDQLRKLYKTASFAGINYLQAGFMIMAAFVLLLPVLHPWYLIWLLPLLLFIPKWSWITFFLLIQFSYALVPGINRQASQLFLLAQYLPFYGLMIWEYLDRRRIKV